MIRIGSILAGDTGEYCGRAGHGHSQSPLANPFPMRGEFDRNRVCDAYEKWLAIKVFAKDKAVMAELERLEKIARAGDLTCLCFCRDLAGAVTKRCHCQTIKSELEHRLASAPEPLPR